MAAPQITATASEVYTPVPQRTQGQTAFDTNADLFLASLPGVSTSINAVSGQINTVANYIEGVALGVEAAKDAAQGSASASAASAATALGYQTATQLSATNAAASAVTATLQAALAVASVANGAKPYATYAAALADLANIATGQIVDVVTDETRSSQRSLYQDNGTTLVFLREVEQYVSPVSYITNQPLNDIITTLLVKVGMIPQDNPTLFGDFANDAYFI